MNFKAKKGYIFRDEATKIVVGDSLDISEDQYSVLEEVKLETAISETIQSEQIDFLVELKDIYSWLDSTDYLVHKVVVGEISTDDDIWIDYISTRKSKIKRVNELRKLIQFGF